MKEQNWKRKEYASWDEAFRGLTPLIRQQSIRVAAYTQVLFVQACKLHYGMNTKDGEDRMRGQYADLAYKCGMYHQLGKALVPPEYQLWQQDFTEEEIAVYKKYTSDGRLLVANLQERSARAKEKRKGEWIEQPTRNIPWLMLREVCEQHMERYDGSGYPAGLKGGEISPIAQIVGLAKELDRVASETKSETPFDIAYEAMIAGSGTAWSADLIQVLVAGKEQCRAVYKKYISYTRTLPKTIPLIDKRPERVMGLSYRPMMQNEAGGVSMYEATPWFGGIANQPGETEGMAELRELFQRTDLVEDVSWYLLYEASDAVLRIANCKLELEGILLNMIPEFYLAGTQLQKFNLLFEQQKIERSSLLLTIPEHIVRTCSKTNMEIIRRYLRNGIVLVLDDYHPDDQLTPAQLLELGFTHLRLSPSLYLNQETANTIHTLRKMGFTVLGGGADTPDILSWLTACGVKCSSGTMTGVEVNENDMIIDSLAREQA
ncbi:MAG: EAL domain-containing protein [Clostridia bacterium]|nr:EAL domain-containing protein [Clostridia bacterium]